VTSRWNGAEQRIKDEHGDSPERHSASRGDVVFDVLREVIDGFRPEFDAGFVKPIPQEMADIVIHVAVTDLVPDLFDHLLDGFELIFGTRTDIPVVVFPGGCHGCNRATG